MKRGHLRISRDGDRLNIEAEGWLGLGLYTLWFLFTLLVAVGCFYTVVRDFT